MVKQRLFVIFFVDIIICGCLIFKICLNCKVYLLHEHKMIRTIKKDTIWTGQQRPQPQEQDINPLSNIKMFGLKTDITILWANI